MALLMVLLLLGLGVSVNSNVYLQKRIFGGQPCDRNKRHFHVRIIADREFMCGGSLIHSQWILTASHCWDKGRTMEAMLRVHRQTSQHSEIIPVSPVFYPKRDKRHDILLLKLQKPVTDIPVPHPDCNKRPAVGDTVHLAGEGPTAPRGPFPVPLYCVDMKVSAVSMEKLTRGYIFLASEAGKDACQGDSGGGVLFNDKIYGVISGIGTTVCDIPVRIMDVCEYWDWIEKEIQTSI